MPELRQNQRFNLRLPCEIVFAARPKLTGKTRNMSSAGVLFTSAGHVSVGEPIEYFITFPKSTGSQTTVRLRCVGKVLREQDGAGFVASLERHEFLRETA